MHNAVYGMALCVCVCVSVCLLQCHVGGVLSNGWMGRARFRHRGYIQLNLHSVVRELGYLRKCGYTSCGSIAPNLADLSASSPQLVECRECRQLRSTVHSHRSIDNNERPPLFTIRSLWRRSSRGLSARLLYSRDFSFGHVRDRPGRHGQILSVYAAYGAVTSQ